MDFAVTVNRKVKIKENEKIEKFLDLARELKKLWNLKIKDILFVIGAHGTVPWSLEKGLVGLEISARIETILTTALLRSARIVRRVQKT